VAGCSSLEADRTAIYKQGFEDGVKHVSERIQTAKNEAISNLRAEVQGRLILVSLIAVTLLFLGSSIAENTRSAIMQHFQLSREIQVKVAVILFILISMLLFLSSFVINELKLVQQGVWILVAGSALPFFWEYIPALEGGDKAGRKAALSKIKSLLFIIIVYWIVFRLLSTEGFLGLEVKTPNPTLSMI
jgi:hypothetical protein